MKTIGRTLSIAHPPDSPSYVHGTNWLIVVAVVAPDAELVAYDSGAGTVTVLYEKAGTDLNGTTNDWQDYADTNSPPESLCEQVPLINQFFSVPAGGVTNVVVRLLVMMPDVDAADVVESNGIHVVTSRPVSVYGLNYEHAAGAAFTAYPTSMLGTNYCILARPSDENNYGSKLAILALENNTTVWITPSPTADLASHASTNAYFKNLDAGETYQDFSYDRADDVTGSWISSDKPIAVYAGAALAQVPDESTQSGNPLVQEQLPVESWGNHVLALSFAGRTNGDSYRILAAYANTAITIRGKVVTIVDEPDDGVNPWTVTTSNEVMVVTNQAGDFYDITVDGPVEFQASQPIQIAQFANGCYADNFTNAPNNSLPEGDPCEILLPPIAHYLQTNIVVTLPNDNVTGDFDENYLNLIVAYSAITNTLVDSQPVPSTNFVAIGTNGYYGAQFWVTNGMHTVTSTQPVGVEVYGFGPADAYGYFGGVVK